jgi:hypothetical protein
MAAFVGFARSRPEAAGAQSSVSAYRIADLPPLRAR